MLLVNLTAAAALLAITFCLAAPSWGRLYDCKRGPAMVAWNNIATVAALVTAVSSTLIGALTFTDVRVLEASGHC